ncbi:MAG: PAS domain-containing protein [bacterium]|nr:PAS domain-containing protein [bacterium]
MQDQVRLQNQIAQIASTVPGMICSFLLRSDGSMCMPYTSPALDEIYGLDAVALAQDAAPLFAIMHPEDAPHVQETINKSAQTMTLWHDEYRVRHPRKGEIWIEGHSMPQLQADGSILWHGFIQDITERKWNERAVYLMSDTQRQIAILDNPEAISQLVGSKVQEIIGDGYTGASLLDDTQQAMRISGLYGMGDLYQKLVRRFESTSPECLCAVCHDA